MTQLTLKNQYIILNFKIIKTIYYFLNAQVKHVRIQLFNLLKHSINIIKNIILLK